MRVVTPQTVKLSLTLETFSLFCDFCLNDKPFNAEQIGALTRENLMQGETFNIQVQSFADVLRSATCVYYCSLIRHNFSQQFHIWASSGQVVCARVQDEDVLMWKLDTCEILPLLAQIAGFRPRILRGNLSRLPYPRLALDFLYLGDASRFLHTAEVYGFPFIEESFTESGRGVEVDGVQDPDRRGKIRTWQAAFIERQDTQKDHHRLLDESSRVCLAFMSFPDAFYIVEGLENHNDPNVFLAPTSAFSQWGALSKLSEVER